MFNIAVCVTALLASTTPQDLWDLQVLIRRSQELAQRQGFLEGLAVGVIGTLVALLVYSSARWRWRRWRLQHPRRAA